MVAEFRYRDRMEGIPIHDEQGSHDRPHDLTTIFVPEKIDAALASLGSRPWSGKRPTIALLLGVEKDGHRFMLSREIDRGIDMRDSLASASTRIAIPVVLPEEDSLAAAGVTQESLGEADPKTLAVAAGGRDVLVGTLVWSDSELGWIADWRIDAAGRAYKWQIRGVSFDDAFRNAMRGVAQVLSGNGNPD
jgi:hypothetical protein